MRLDVTRVAPDRIRFVVLRRRPRHPAATSASACSSASTAPTAAGRDGSGGAGLGLAIVRAIAEAHKGSVRVRDSQNGRGAAIELVLPGFETS